MEEEVGGAASTRPAAEAARLVVDHLEAEVFPVVAAVRLVVTELLAEEDGRHENIRPCRIPCVTPST